MNDSCRSAALNDIFDKRVSPKVTASKMSLAYAIQKLTSALSLILSSLIALSFPLVTRKRHFRQPALGYPRIRAAVRHAGKRRFIRSFRRHGVDTSKALFSFRGCWL